MSHHLVPVLSNDHHDPLPHPSNGTAGLVLQTRLADLEVRLAELTYRLSELTTRNAELTTRVGELEKQLKAAESPSPTKTESPSPMTTATLAVPTPTDPTVLPEPAPTPDTSDELEIIEGIGRKIGALFRRCGVVTFRQLANTDIKRMKEILVSGGKAYSAANPATWAEQARYAADGDLEKLKAFKERIRRGLVFAPSTTP